MGWLDELTDTLASFKDVSDALQGIKDDFIESVVGPSQDLAGTVTDIATSLTDDK